MTRIRSRLTYSNVVSTLCLFLLLGGVAYATTSPPKNSVGSKQLKPNAVNGSKVADHSLTAADIKGPVDSALSATNANHAIAADHAAGADNATNAGHAANSDTLAGFGPSSFFPSSKVQRLDLAVIQSTVGSQTKPLLSMGPLTMTITCAFGSGVQSIGINASSTVSSASVGGGFSSTASPNAGGAVIALSSSPSAIITRTQGIEGDAGGGVLVYRDPTTTIALQFRYFVTTLSNECQVFGVATQA